jgi:YVTN family beta-propeller protein
VKYAGRRAMTSRVPACIALVLFAWVSLGLSIKSACASDARAVPLHKIADIPLGGRPTRLDYVSFDPGRHLLYIAHLGDSEVIVFDVNTSRVVGRIGDLSSVHGVLAIPELGRAYATATGSKEVVAIDPATMTTTARIPAGGYPDGLAYAPDAHKLYVSDERGGDEAVVDVRSNTKVATVSLGGEAGNTQYDSVSRHVFVNVQTRAQLVEIDPFSDTVIARYDLRGAKGNHGLLIDSEDRLAFIACEGNDTLLIFDMRTKRVTASFRVGAGPDVLAYDDAYHYLYVASESGLASILRVASSGVTKLGEFVAGPNAHVVGVDRTTHRVYFPLKNLDGHTALRVFEATQ